MGVALREEYMPVCDRPCWVSVHVCVYFLMEESYKERGYCVRVFAHGIFCCFCASCSDKSNMIREGGGKNMKWDINFKLLSLLFINSLLCAFSADVPVTRSVTVSNELHSPPHFIYWTDPLFTPI